MALTRRGMLLSTGGALAAGTLPIRQALAAAPEGNDLKFIFVMNYGGWDPTRIFATEFDNPSVDMERDSWRASAGNLDFVEHAGRPAVSEYLQNHHARTTFLNGVLVSSVAHENCLRISMTGSTAQDRSDWGAILGGQRTDRYTLPQIVVGGPSFPGDYGTSVTRTGTSGQLEALLSGDIISWSDLPVDAPDWRAEDVMDRYLQGRTAAAADNARSPELAALRASYQLAVDRSLELKDLQRVVDWSGATSFSGQARLAVDLLALDISRVATLQFSYYGWDTHASNDIYQSYNFQQLFTELNNLTNMLQTTAGTTQPTLADETVVVVLSEMGRTPALNAQDGKDHWPYTSVMITGPGFAGDRVVGGYDLNYYGLPIDLASGDTVDEGTLLSSDVVGATLLAAADIDPAPFTSGIKPLTAVLD